MPLDPPIDMLLDEIRLLLRELVLQAGGNPEAISPEKEPWDREGDGRPRTGER